MSERHVVDGANRRVILIGAGVVGRSIAVAHLSAGIPVELVDTNPQVLSLAVAYLSGLGFHAAAPSDFAAGGLAAAVTPTADPLVSESPQVLVIESIVERREPKRDVLAALDRHFEDAAIIATNTSSLRLSDLESATQRPERFCGLHFFMPVERRAMVEVVQGGRTDEATLAVAEAHVRRLHKQPLRVADSPGFVVNRILSPYLNQSMLLLGSGADPGVIRRMAMQFGMPFSPLELIDLIGARTAFDAGRAFWQAFPRRIDPAPVLPGMVKAGLNGCASGRGFYQYDAESDASTAFETLSPPAQEVVERYRRHEQDWSPAEIYEQLTLPMLIEAACLLRDRVVRSTDDIETAMRGGLDFASEIGFFATFDIQGTAAIAERVRELGPTCKALDAPAGFPRALEAHGSVAAAVTAFATE